MTQTARQLPSNPPAEAPATGVLVNVVVLTGDQPLYEAIRHSVGERNPVWRARSAEESVELLVTGRCGVLLIDMGAVSAEPATLIEQVVEQFPDVVVVVAGRRDDEQVLGGLISEGRVYRFMHKPLSPRRAGMFLNAAIRAHVERRDGRADDFLLPLVAELRSRHDVRKFVLVGFGLALFMVAVAAALIWQFGMPRDPAPPSGADAPSRAAATPVATAPLADPVLSRARAAYSAERYEAPAGRNALDLFAAVLLARPGDAEARTGLDATIVRILELAERNAGSGNDAEAKRLAERVLAVDTEHAAARALLARLQPPPAAKAPPAAERVPAPPPVALPAPAEIPPRRPIASGATTKRSTHATVPVHRIPPSPPPVTRALVQPDPLRPRVVNADAVPPSRPLRTTSGSSPGSRVAAPLPIAGYERRAPEELSFSPGTLAVGPPLPDRDLTPVATPEPRYPPEAFRRRVEGWAEVEFTVTADGKTRDIAVVDATPRGVFDAAAADAIASWRYLPRVANGRPVQQRTSVTVRFSVDD